MEVYSMEKESKRKNTKTDTQKEKDSEKNTPDWADWAGSPSSHYPYAKFQKGLLPLR
jgi:hypothetical protein